mmetsp:Transcript_53289/g.169320  ORF Transcript_53289/g.169320 Transcript_53289/m.169320 type:complete len:232 (+) Transcript_53289:2001-2696(+)
MSKKYSWKRSRWRTRYRRKLLAPLRSREWPKTAHTLCLRRCLGSVARVRVLLASSFSIVSAKSAHMRSCWERSLRMNFSWPNSLSMSSSSAVSALACFLYQRRSERYSMRCARMAAAWSLTSLAASFILEKALLVSGMFESSSRYSWKFPSSYTQSLSRLDPPNSDAMSSEVSERTDSAPSSPLSEGGSIAIRGLAWAGLMIGFRMFCRLPSLFVSPRPGFSPMGMFLVPL